MAIEIYNKYTKYNDALLNNGLYALDNITIKAETTEDIYGNYELNIELELLNNVPTSLYELIEVDNIIKVNDEGSEELFRIAQVEKGLETIELHCRHITISDSLNLWLNNVKPTNLNGMGALQWLAQRTEPKCNIIFSSNLANTSTADYVKMSLYDALFTSDNAFIKRWGGEVKRTGYTVRIDDRIGIDKTGTIKIKEALNLTNFNAKTNIDEVITVIHPVGAEGLSADRVVSDMVNNYSMEFPRKIEYKDVKVKKVNEQGEVTQEGFETEELAKAELIRLAKEEFTKNHIDQLQFTCDIDYLDLNKFEEYKDLAQIQTANLGDFISVRVDTFDMDIKARIVNRVYDVLRGRRIENTISTDGKLKKPVDINKIIEDLADKIEGEGFEDLSGYIDSMIQQGFKNGYLIYDKNACYAVDTLPKEKAKNVVVLNRNGLGYSSTGIAGPYKYGFTIDGKLNADMITTGALSGQYIKGGTIEANKLTVQAKQNIAEGFASTDAFINLDASVTGLNSTVGTIKNTVNGQDAKISKIDQKADSISLSVQNKVGKNDIISSINLSKEGIKIKANKLEVTGDFITKSDLVDGVTTISGSNIQTGTIKGQNIEACSFSGKNLVYIQNNGLLSCDGDTNLKHLRIHETHQGWSGKGSFSCGPIGYFDKSIRVKDWARVQADKYDAGWPLVASYPFGGKWLDVKGLALGKIYNGNGSLLVKPWNNENEFWIEMQFSDEKLKENIAPVDTGKPFGGHKIGLDLINSIEHKTFNFIGATESIDCGYIAQDLKKLNPNIIEEHEQPDGSTLMGPRIGMIVPQITLAIQQQQKIIDGQHVIIEDLLKRVEALETKIINK